MKIAIIGSRNYPRPELIIDYIARLPPGTTIISGGARGVDSVAETQASLRNIPITHKRKTEVFDSHGKLIQNLSSPISGETVTTPIPIPGAPDGNEIVV